MPKFNKLFHFFNLSHLFKKHTEVELMELMKPGRFFVSFMVILCQILLIVTVIVPTLRIYDRYMAYKEPRIGVVNITGIADEFVKAQSQSNLSSEELKQRVYLFGATLEKVLHDVSAKKRLVLIPAEAVISGAKDYTQEVRQQISQIIKAESKPGKQQELQQPIALPQQPLLIGGQPEPQAPKKAIQEHRVLPQEISEAQSDGETKASHIIQE